MSFLLNLGTIFIVLKLTDNIDWSWWYVVMPLYLIPALFIIGITLLSIDKMIMTLIKKTEKDK